MTKIRLFIPPAVWRLVGAAGLMIFRRGADTAEAPRFMFSRPLSWGQGRDLGLTGVAGGVFLTPMLIAFGWASPRRAAALSPPFIFCHSVLTSAGVLLAGQRFAPGTTLYGIGAL